MNSQEALVNAFNKYAADLNSQEILSLMGDMRAGLINTVGAEFDNMATAYMKLKTDEYGRTPKEQFSNHLVQIASSNNSLWSGGQSSITNMGETIRRQAALKALEDLRLNKSKWERAAEEANKEVDTS